MAIRDALTRPRNWAAGTAILLAAIVEASLWIPGFYDELVAWQTAIAALLGFSGLIVAALYNAELNRRRDRDLLDEKRRSLAAALLAELHHARWKAEPLARFLDQEYKRAVDHRTGTDALNRIETVPWPRLANRLFDSVGADLGILGRELTRDVVHCYGLVADLSWYERRAVSSAERRALPAFGRDDRRLEFTLMAAERQIGALISSIEDVLPRLQELAEIAPPPVPVSAPEGSPENDE